MQPKEFKNYLRRKKGNTFCFQIRAGTSTSWENYGFRVLKQSVNELLQTTSRVQCKILRSWQRQVGIYQELYEIIFPSLPFSTSHSKVKCCTQPVSFYFNMRWHLPCPSTHRTLWQKSCMPFCVACILGQLSKNQQNQKTHHWNQNNAVFIQSFHLYIIAWKVLFQSYTPQGIRH